jgi:hypothetical protein
VVTVEFDLLDMAALRLTLAPFQHHSLVRQEYGRTIPLAELDQSMHCNAALSVSKYKCGRSYGPDHTLILPSVQVTVLPPTQISLPSHVNAACSSESGTPDGNVFFGILGVTTRPRGLDESVCPMWHRDRAPRYANELAEVV